MTTSVTFINEDHGHGAVDVIRRDVPSGGETVLITLPETERFTTHVWDGCELVVREVKRV